MARPPKKIVVKESAGELKSLMRSAAPHKRVRLQLLLLLSQPTAMGKHKLAAALSVSHNTIQSWRSHYENGGVEALLADKRKGNRTSVITTDVDQAIVARLSDPLNAPRSYKELQQWVDENYIKGIHYQTLNKHVKNKHGAKIKVARKSHINKKPEAAETFKKN